MNKKNTFLLFYHLQNSKFVFSCHFPLLAFHYLILTPAIEKITGDKSSKIFHETRFSAIGHLLLPQQSTCHLPHPLVQIGPRSMLRYIGHFLKTLPHDTMMMMMMMMMMPLNEIYLQRPIT
jgi:hypothetical protein